MGLPLLLLITLIILLIFSQDVTIRIHGTRDIRLTVSLTVFAVELPLSSTKKKKRKKGGNFAGILPDALKRLLPQADIRVRSARFAEAEIYSSPSSMISGSIALSLFLIHLGRHSGTFSRDGESSEAIDIFLTFPLTLVFISLIKSLYYSIKKRTSRRRKNARARNR